MEPVNQSNIKVENGATTECIEIEIPYDLYQYLKSGDYNTHTICRLCLSLQNNIMYPLISDQENNGLSEMLKAFTTIEIQPEEGLPFLVCESCKSQVIHCYEFKLKCEKTDFTLKSILKGEFCPKNEEVLHEPPPVANEKNHTKQHYNDDNIDSNVSVKMEPVFEDAQYLENDMTCENDNMNIIQNTAKRKKKTKIKSMTDLNVFHEDESRKKNNKYLKCSFCSKNFQKAKTLQAHMKSKHKDIRLSFPCAQCNDSFNSEHDLFVHSALHSKTAWSCNQCHKVFNAKHTLRRHIQRHMECKRYSCMACDKSFVELYALRRHARVHTGEVVEKKHACDICDKKYSESCLLAAHVSSAHLGQRPCACAQCGKHFASPRLLASHRRLHTDDKPFACRYCDKRFRHKSTRNTHHRTHTGEKPYVCSYCGKTFIQNSNLTLHLRTHTGERPYSCGVCARSFTSGSALKTHERTHTGERPYTCPVCGKSFARMNMKVHMRLHTGERPHRCGACGKTYVTASRLKDHAKVHTGERPYECASCMKNYSSRSHLVKHIKAHQLAKRKAHQRKDTSHQRKETVIVQHVREHKQDEEIVVENGAEEYDTESNKGIILEESEVPLEMQGEICINPNVVNFVNNDFANDVNLVTVNEGGLSISAASGVLEAATVKLYQVDQSLVQIHSSGGQVTISKITSKMTANF